jgi:hypothetical protein
LIAADTSTWIAFLEGDTIVLLGTGGALRAKVLATRRTACLGDAPIAQSCFPTLQAIIEAAKNPPKK